MQMICWIQIIMSLSAYYNEQNTFEIGVDEAGRGPLFGRLYVAATVLPKGTEFQHQWMKDSKRFHSKKKISEMSDYIKANAIAWSIQYIEADVIDQINIRQAVHRGMHNSIRDIFTNRAINSRETLLLIDGNDFRPYSIFDETTEELFTVPHETIEGGDNKYTAIAAASILAKVARDEYIHELCTLHPELDDKYHLNKNQGYGTKQHLDGILEHGVTQWHRKTYGRCKEAELNQIV
jgi:ribonuclease HII